jgi:hypothetical protein
VIPSIDGNSVLTGSKIIIVEEVGQSHIYSRAHHIGYSILGND